MTANSPTLPKTDEFRQQLEQRQWRGRLWGRVYFASNIIALITLILLFINIANGAFGYVAMRYKIDPATLSERPLEELDSAALGQIILTSAPKQLRVLIRDTLSVVDPKVFTKTPLSEALAGKIVPDDLKTLTINDLSDEQLLALLETNTTRDDLYTIIMKNLVEPTVVESWQLFPSLFERAAIEAEVASKEGAQLVFRSWVTPEFLRNPISSDATTAGLRTALYGTFWVIGICVVFAFPLGIGAAIYLEEYAPTMNSITLLRMGNRTLTVGTINAIIEVNIRNLAGVPSIIYGMLGLTVFVRMFEFFTSGRFVGITDSNGRTVLSAGLTLGLVILPVIIINAQEAIRAVPSSIREASFGLGATKWQTISRQVLPASLPGILTGIILSLSRAVGETAPLIVVGASTFITVDPNGPFSKFTVVPIQIYQWTARPELEFKNAAAAAIIVLMVVLLLMNSTAIVLRNYYTRKLTA